MNLRHDPTFSLSIAVCAIIISLAPAYAAQPESPSIYSAPDDMHIAFSPDSVTATQGSIKLRSNKYSGPLCVAFTELSRYPGSGSPRYDLNVGLYSSNGLSRLSLDGSPEDIQEVLSGDFPVHSHQNDVISLSYMAKSFPSTLPSPGIYTIVLRADLYAGAFVMPGGAVDSITFNLVIHVDSHYDLSITGKNEGFSLLSTGKTLDFGTLVSGDSRGADVFVKSNVVFALAFSSLNGGALANAAGSGLIRYVLHVNGAVLPLSPGNPAHVPGGSVPGYGTAERFAVMVTILPMPDLPADGAYSDVITVILSAR